METNARYLLMGSFTLTVLAALFGFVFWLDRTGGMGEKQAYVVRFEHSVSGLQPGAAVLFDGLRVGEVSTLTLDPTDPRHVLATIKVATGTPIRKDTKAGIEYQGLMGTAAVSLEGGSSVEAAAMGPGGTPATLMADAAASQSLTQSAQETLGHVDKVILENSDSLHSAIDNLKTFSGALARNSNRVDGVMAGLERMTGGGPVVPTPAVYDLAVPKLAGWPGTLLRAQFVIADPTAVIALQTQRLLTRSADGQLSPLGAIQWSDTLPKMLQEKVLQGFEDAGIAATIEPPLEPNKTGRLLQIDLRSFEIATIDSTADIAFSATILSGDGKVLSMHVFRATAAASSVDGVIAVRGLNTAFDTAVRDMAAWMLTMS